MTDDLDGWRARAGDLADRLVRQGAITDPVWREVVASVPRHAFVPAFYDDASGLVGAGDPRWLDAVYNDDTLVTQRMEHPEQPGFAWSTSSTTRPSLMLRMLELLDVSGGMTVLEVGTGTGYNAALLCERVSSGNVTSIDIDPALVDAARGRLADAGYRPHLAACDGALGCPGRAPFDRVIATVAFERVPWAWIEQVRPGGVVLADVRPRGMTWAGALARLTVDGDGTASGPLVDCTWGFMSARTGVERPGIPEVVHIDATSVRSRTSEVGAGALHTPGLSLLVWHRLPGVNAFPGEDGTQITAPDGSWAKVSTRVPARVEYGGPSDVWTDVEAAHAWWIEHGRPGVGAFGLTVEPDGQRLGRRTSEGTEPVGDLG
ncbi:methyltransferase domain-containing protein [Actinomadura sp. WMMB 499]|uniref:methyltransferase domain-containing protein n=1 Tax=Actinomadura sp. WMMB 499 TaxID=1219491 RepID=UPI001245DE63|nr:methyltransferase domain-containing protein [Actinomadura sp. WMMB 499]QFG24137.1 methyltransferase domain-containing protein [Actinomadura sp. WMMB 499]